MMTWSSSSPTILRSDPMIAAENGAYVVHGTGEGLGVAMYRGLKAAVSFEPDVIVAVDGDGQADAAEEIKRSSIPSTTTWRTSSSAPGSCRPVSCTTPTARSIVWAHACFRLFYAQTGLDLTDSHGGIRAMIPDVAADLEMLGTQTYVQETILDAVEKGYRVIEISSVWRRREHGKSRVLGRFRNSFLCYPCRCYDRGIISACFIGRPGARPAGLCNLHHCAGTAGLHPPARSPPSGAGAGGLVHHDGIAAVLLRIRVAAAQADQAQCRSRAVDASHLRRRVTSVHARCAHR